jgi:acyl-CoA reductase-like NAD-dependent aldehyde dehydrogenase
MSAYLSRAGIAGLIRLGDILVPGDERLPSFSDSGCVHEVDRMMDALYEDDRRDLCRLLSCFGFLPTIVLRAVFSLVPPGSRLPGLLGAPFRTLDIGTKGVVMTLYWSNVASGFDLHGGIGFDAHVVTENEAPIAEVLRKPDWQASTDGMSAAQAALTRARAASPALKRLSLQERTAYLERLRDIILRRRDEIVERIQQETGKSRSDALISEIYGVLEYLAWATKHGPRHLSDRKQHTPLTMMGKTSMTWYQPLGTVLVISPWNYPFHQAIVPIATALLTGNTIVYKPSEWTPLEGLLEELLAEAQVPPTWVQIVYGDGKIGAELIEAKPDKVFFTGSTRTGRNILKAAAEHLIPVELELGGKDAMIVFSDVHVERAAAGCVWGALTNTGQSCTSVERVYVERTIYEAFRNELVRQVERVVQDVDSDGGSDIGAMTTDFQVEIVANQLRDAKKNGARFRTETGWESAADSGRLIPPVVLDDPSADLEISNEETFGPVIALHPFDNEAEVILRANDSPYGLTASVWSKDLDRARRVARALDVGGVSINNVMLTEGNPALPFGGVKASGFGRNKGEAGLHGFCNIKSVLVDKDSAKIEANWYPYTTEKYRLFDSMTEALFSRGPARWIRFALAGLGLEKYADKAAKERGPRER